MKKLSVFLVAFFLLFSTMPVSALAAAKVKPPRNPVVVTEPIATEPIVTEPTVTEPTTEPTTTEPTVAEPTTVEPTVIEPVVTEPVVTEPAVTEPTPTTNNYGLIANDASKKDENAALLSRALNTYGSITLNGSFYIGNTTEVVTNPNVQITGLNATELIFQNRTKALLNPSTTRNLAITNVKFTNLAGASPLVIVYEDEKSSAKVDRVEVKGCTFQGDISFYRLKGNTGNNPETLDFGIDQFIFTDNQVLNTGNTFIVLNDIPFNYVEISNNTIQNFRHVLVYMGVTNDTAYESQLKESRKLVGVYNNSVKNDDNWWDEQSTSLYHAFILAENKEVVYDSNHVEGMKADFDVALYDAYLSASSVTYTNNTWKNNICFNDYKTNNALIKSKSGAGPLTRVYTNNTFIVEEAYADRLGKPKSQLHVDFMDLTQYAENYTVAHNIIDVYDLRFPVASEEINHFVFNNNDVKAKYVLGKLASIRLTDNYQPTVQINNNRIQIEQTGAHPSGSTEGFKLVYVRDSRTNTANGLVKSIEVKENIIHGPLTYVFYTPLSDTMTVQNNQFSVAASQYKKFVYGGNHPEIANTPVTKY